MALLPASPTPLSRWLVIAMVALAALVAAAPLGLGFSTGMTKDNAPDAGAFAQFGCTACHGESHAFPALNMNDVKVSVVKTEGGAPLNGPYEAHGLYTITITLDEQNMPAAANRAGFNLRAAAGKLSAVDGQSQVSGDGMEAAHVGPGRTSWQVGWEAPEEGAAGFSLFVNDVDGSGAPDLGDHVYWLQFGFGDHDGATLGAAEEHEVHFGISLQQYWVGLFGLAGMLFVMVAGFVYLKFVNPHNTDQKDR